MKIFKQNLTIEDSQEISLPVGSKILTIQIQHEQPTIWYECDPYNERELVKIAIYPTGAELPENPGTYIGTFQLMMGQLVFHAYRK